MGLEGSEFISIGAEIAVETASFFLLRLMIQQQQHTIHEMIMQIQHKRKIPPNIGPTVTPTKKFV